MSYDRLLHSRLHLRTELRLKRSYDPLESFMRFTDMYFADMQQ